MSYLKSLKLKLQFTGWLQYIIPLVFASLLSLVGLFFSFLSLSSVAMGFFFLASSLVIITLFDVITIKYNIRPKEKLPKALDDLDSFSLMRARVACRSFQNTSLTAEHHSKLMRKVEEYTGLKDDNFGNNPIRFEYMKAPLTVWPVVGASEFLVAIVPKAYNSDAVLDVGRNLQHIVHYATKMGLATCWIGPGADQSSMVASLGQKFDTNSEHIICVCAIGYQSMYKPFLLRIVSIFRHTRVGLDKLFFEDSTFSKACKLETAPFTHLKRTYEACQWAPSSFNGQTTRCVLHHDDNSVFQADFYTSTLSKYYAPVALGIWCANWETGCESLGFKGGFEVKSIEHEMETPKYYISWMKI